MRLSDGRRVLLIVAVSAAAMLAGACKEKNTYVEPPPPKVTVARPLQQEITDYLEFTGTTQASEEVQVRARVSGLLQSMHFEPGTLVKKDQLLFVIDPRQYRARLDVAKAEKTRAEAQLRRAGIELSRARKLFQQKAGPERDVVTWEGERDVARAAIEMAEARIEQAELDLGYTQVTAPIAGRVSRNFVDVGNLVGEGDPTLLATVTRYDPIYAYFNLNERDFLKVMALYRERAAARGLDPDTDPGDRADIPVYLGLADDTEFTHQGIYDYAESGLDPQTGTLQLRGKFANREFPPRLMPGLFARLRLPVGQRTDALLVTERAVGADQTGRYLLVVNSSDVVEKRPIRTGNLVDGMLVIEQGLKPDERVIVNGMLRARPGATVVVNEVEMASYKTSALQAAAAEDPKKAPSDANGKVRNATAAAGPSADTSPTAARAE